MPEDAIALVRRLFAAFNRRDQSVIEGLCDEGIEFIPVATAEILGRTRPYHGHAGLGEYLADIGEAWEELIVTPGEVAREGDALLVRGRVYTRSRERGIRDFQVTWVWRLRGERFLRGEVFLDPAAAVQRYRAEAAVDAGR